MTLHSPMELVAQVKRLEKAMQDDVWHGPVGMKMKAAAAQAVRTDIGDLSMSGWPRKKPADILVSWKSQDRENGIIVRPMGRAAGNWRVLEDGRKAYRAGQARFRGTRKASKFRGEVTRIAFTTRNVGATEGKQTWSDAVDIMGRTAPMEITKAKVAAVRKAWR